MEKYGKQIDANDNVVTAVADCDAGDKITVKFQSDQRQYVCNQPVPFGHKIAITDVKAGEKVIKYGQPIGAASKDIKTGDWVHTHNTVDTYKVVDKDGVPLPGQDG